MASLTSHLQARDRRARALLAPARELRSDREVDVRGVALAERLLSDGAGPLYMRGDGEQLWHAARDADCALRRSGRC